MESEDQMTVCEILKEVVTNPVVNVQFKHESLSNIIAAYKTNTYTKESLECFKKCVYELIVLPNYPHIKYDVFKEIVEIQTKRVNLHSGIAWGKTNRLVYCDVILHLKRFFEQNGISCESSSTSKKCVNQRQRAEQSGMNNGIELEQPPPINNSYDEDGLWPLRRHRDGGKRQSRKSRKSSRKSKKSSRKSRKSSRKSRKSRK